MEDLTTTQIRRQDLKFLDSIKRKKRKVSIWAVLESVVKMIREHKLEEELK